MSQARGCHDVTLHGPESPQCTGPSPSNYGLQPTPGSLVSLEVTWENPRHPVPGRDRPIQPWSAETGAERGSSRPGLLKPVQLSGAIEPVSARSGRQEFL